MKNTETGFPRIVAAGRFPGDPHGFEVGLMVEEKGEIVDMMCPDWTSVRAVSDRIWTVSRIERVYRVTEEPRVQVIDELGNVRHEFPLGWIEYAPTKAAKKSVEPLADMGGDDG